MTLSRRAALIAAPLLLSLILVKAFSRNAPPARLSPGPQPGGGFLVTTNQVVAPFGNTIRLDYARPKDIALSPDGKTLAVLTTSAARGVVLYSIPDGKEIARVGFQAGALGIAWSPDGASLYASGENGKIRRISRETAATPWSVFASFPADADKGNPQVNGLAVAPSGKLLYAALGTRNAIAVIALPKGEILSTIPVGVAPYNLALSPNGGTLYVAERGGRRAGPKDLHTEPSAGAPVRVDPATDSNASGGVAFLNTATLEVKELEVGRQPAGMIPSDDGKTLYVADANGDLIYVIDARNRRITQTIPLAPTVSAADKPSLHGASAGFGQMPTSLALSDDGKTLYVACGGANAVAVIPLNAKSVAGWIPAGWFPVAVAQKDGALYVASTKGLGARPEDKTPGRWYVHDSVGTVQLIPAVAKADLAALSAQVAANNHWGPEPPKREGIKPVPAPERVGEPSVFKHVVYIIKENQTYDAILGDMPEGNGDKALCLYPEVVTPNHHALARQFVLLDNTFTSGTNSADGHQWCDEAMANAYMEQNYSAHIRSYPYDGGDPLAYAPTGFLWNAVARRGLDVRVYGEFVNHAKVEGGPVNWSALYKDYQSGGHKYKITAETDSAALRPYLHPNYIGWPTEVSDQWRASVFLSDLSAFEKKGKMPSLCMLLLPCDHTSGTERGMPTPRAALADNDLALGRIVEGISKSPFWKDTLILVIEDDSQADVDHVDGHRTACFCVSPYTRRGAVVSETYNHTSLLRTIELVLGLPAMNRFDRSATPMTACFAPTPDFRPYAAIPNRVPLDEINGSPKKMSGAARRLAEACARLDWSGLDRADPNIVARADWNNRKPGVPFPAHLYRPEPEDDGDEK